MKLKLLIILILTSQFVFSQVNRQYMGLAAGPSFPLSDFGKTDLNDSTSGWAKTGIALEFTYSYRLTHNFGLQGLINYSSNRFDNIRYGDALTAAYSLDDSSPDTSFSVESSRNWSSGGILIGPFLRFPLSESLSWDIKASVGFFGVSSPTAIIYGTISTGEKLEDYYRQSGKGYGFAYSFGTGFKYKLSKYYLLLFANYYSSSVKIDNVSGWDWNSEPYITSFKQNISYLSVTFGAGYFF